MNFDYTKTTEKSFDVAVKLVEEEIAKSGMRVLHIHDVQENLEESHLKLLSFVMPNMPMIF